MNCQRAQEWEGEAGSRTSLRQPSHHPYRQPCVSRPRSLTYADLDQRWREGKRSPADLDPEYHAWYRREERLGFGLVAICGTLLFVLFAALLSAVTRR